MTFERSKTCTCCHKNKKLSRFHNDASRPDGKINQCKPCKNKKVRVYRLKNRGYDLDRKKNYRKKFPAKIKKYNHRYYRLINNGETVQ